MMNGTVTTEQRLVRKRALEAELAVVRAQKTDVLRQIGQIAKKQRLGGPPPPGAHLTHDAKVDHERRYHLEEQAKVWNACSRILAEVLKNRDTKTYFGEPVHRTMYPDYYNIVKEPRDLGTIKKNLESGAYPDLASFRDDVRLCFQNCRSFNPPGHFIRNFGDAASERFELKWARSGVEAAWAQAQARHELAMARLDAEHRSLPDAIAEADAELQALVEKARAREAPPPPGPGREMTFEEKRKLSHAMGTFPGERLARVLEIVAAGPSAPPAEAGAEECDLDIDALDVDTLWKLQEYVDAVLAEAEAKAARAPAPAAPAAGGGAGAGAAPAAPKAEPAQAPTGGDGSESEEGVGSKGNDSTMEDAAAGAAPAKRNDDAAAAAAADDDMPDAPPQAAPPSPPAPVSAFAAAAARPAEGSGEGEGAGGEAPAPPPPPPAP